MSSLVIVKPLYGTIIGGVTPANDAKRLMTPDPKEAAILGNSSILIDFGSPIALDCLYVGYHSAAGNQTTALYPSNANGDLGPAVTGGGLAPLGIGEPSQSFFRGASVSSRYFTIAFSGNGSAAFYAGVVAVGSAFQPFYGHELGGGRLVTDTGSADRLFGGGFAINEGAIAGGWEWTLGDLSLDEMRALYTRILRQVGNTKTVLAVEDPDQIDGLNECIHWGLLTKIDRYERFAPNACRLSLRIDDWA